jgi:hypothetical protein
MPEVIIAQHRGGQRKLVVDTGVEVGVSRSEVQIVSSMIDI